jgi:hypothetical protein
MTRNVRKTVSTIDLQRPAHTDSVFEQPNSSTMTSHSSMTAQFSDDLRRIQKHFNHGVSRPSTGNPSTSQAPFDTVAMSLKVENASPKTPESSKVLRQSNPFADVSCFKEMSDVLDSIGRGGSYEKPESYGNARPDFWTPSFAPRKVDEGFAGTNLQTSKNSATAQSAVVLDHPHRTKNEIAADYTQPFCDFLTDNPTVFHTVTAFAEELADAGYTKISERDSWKIKKGGKYFVERNGSSMIAFSVGDDYEPGNGAAIVAGHIDALTAKLKPIPKLNTKAGYVQLGVAPYAGALNSTWWDRDLSIGGRVLVKESSGKISSKLVKLNWPSR